MRNVHSRQCHFASIFFFAAFFFVFGEEPEVGDAIGLDTADDAAEPGTDDDGEFAFGIESDNVDEIETNGAGLTFGELAVEKDDTFGAFEKSAQLLALDARGDTSENEADRPF